MIAERRRRLNARRAAMRSRRAVSVSVLTFVALLAWIAAGPPAMRAAVAHMSIAGMPTHAGVGQDDNLLGRRQFATRLASTFCQQQQNCRVPGDGAGDRFALVSAHVALSADTAREAQADLDRRGVRRSPHDDPAPYDATAPPSRISQAG